MASRRSLLPNGKTRSTGIACAGRSITRRIAKPRTRRSQWVRPSRWFRKHQPEDKHSGEPMQIHLLARTAAIAVALTFSSLGRAAEPYWPDHLTIGTASPGGTYFVYGAGLAQILTRALDLPVVTRPTEGPAENIALLEAGEAKLGFVTVGVALQAWNATGAWAGKKPARSMRAIFPMYDTPFQLLVLQDSGARTLADLSGKRVGVGPRGGTSAAYFPEFFNTLKIPVIAVFGEWSELAA